MHFFAGRPLFYGPAMLRTLPIYLLLELSMLVDSRRGPPKPENQKCSYCSYADRKEGSNNETRGTIRRWSNHHIPEEAYVSNDEERLHRAFQ